MRIIPAVLAVALAASACAAQSTTQTTQPPLEYPHAGIAVTLPTGFHQEPLTDPYDVFRASLRSDDDQPLVAVSLAAYPLDEASTTDSLAEQMQTEAAQALQVRNFENLSQTELPIARSRGLATMSYYEYRGEPTVAARAFLVREVDPEAGIRIGYVLTVESTPQEKDRMLAVFGEVVESVRMLGIRRPTKIEADDFADPVGREELGFRMRPLHAWYAAETPAGVETGQVDYQTGRVMPVARLIVADIPPHADAETCAREDLQRALKQGEDRGVITETLSQGPAEVGGLSGYQFVLRKRVGAKHDQPAGDGEQGGQAEQPAQPAKAAPGPATIIAQRIVCVSGQTVGGGGGGRRYTLILIGQGEDPEPLVGILDRLAAGVEILVPTTRPATQPTTVPAATTQASTQPGTLPVPSTQPSATP